MAVSGKRIGPDDVSVGSLGASGDEPGGRDGAAGDPGARITKQAGPAFRWLAWAAVGLPVVFA